VIPSVVKDIEERNLDYGYVATRFFGRLFFTLQGVSRAGEIKVNPRILCSEIAIGFRLWRGDASDMSTIVSSPRIPYSSADFLDPGSRQNEEE
jgi:hypothetical protein